MHVQKFDGDQFSLRAQYKRTTITTMYQFTFGFLFYSHVFNLGLGYFTPRSTQPSIPPGSVNEYQLRLGRQRQVWFIPIADVRVGVQVKL